MSDPSATANATADATATATTSAAAGLKLGGSGATFSIIGIVLAVSSGLFIGVSFVVKKKGLLAATRKTGNAAGEGHAYLKNWLWWTGMILMVLGEILNFVAYAFTVAILVAPMGSVSVVVAAILSHFFLQESLTFFGWIGCTLCILGSVILALNAPHEQSVRTIPEFLKYFISPGYLVWMSLMFAISLVIVFYVAPRWGKKTMLPYISVCSLVGGISVSCTQGLGSAIVTSIQGESQIKHWFFWFLLIFVVVTLLIEINYLNKALELFNTSMVVPVYFCFFTTATMITSFILYRGLKASAVALVTMVMGFLVICLGITLLQMSKVDPKQLQGLDRRSTLLLQASKHKTEAEEKGELMGAEEPGMDALRGGFGAVGSIIRARSVQRRMSTASSSGMSSRPSLHRAQYGSQPGLNTHGLSHLPRYQLSDNPVPDEMEHIALSPADQYSSPQFNTGGHPSTTPQATPKQRSQSTLKFDDADVVHKYGYTPGGQSEATHTVLSHDNLRGDGNAFSERMLTPGQREKLNQPTDYFGDVDQRRRDSKTHFAQLFGTITHSMNPSSPHPSPTATHGFPINFPMPGRNNNDQVRGGAHRGMRDYPHLKHDQDAERAERAKLVESPEHSDLEAEAEDAPALGDIGSPQQSGAISGLPSAGVGRRSDTRKPMGPR